MTVEILLATYNGERFLREQLESLLAQTHGDWRLLVRDDGSTDRTEAILEEAQAEHPERIDIVRDDFGRLGATRNFLRLLELSRGPYIMFSDHDDVWLPDKIRVSLTALRQAEEESPNLPMLVHTDLTVVDAALQHLADSFWQVRRIQIDDRDPLSSLVHLNGVTGCTILMNRRAREVSLPAPAHVRLHDWWIALNVASKGRIISLAQPTVLYRQHETNAIGAPGRNRLFLGRMAHDLRTFPTRLYWDYRIVRQVVPSVSFFPWCIRYMTALAASQMHRHGPD
jgi:glycosyltransferase involved in cell wall biosynthesis